MSATRLVPTATSVGSEHVQPTGAVAGYRPGRTLRLSVELRRQFKRRRTIGVFLLMIALPLILIGALNLGGSDEAQRNSRINLVDVATSSGLNFTLFVLFATTGFFLVVVFALFFGDTVASEAQWGSLRYTLATPVPRMRLLRQKWYAALVLSIGAFVLLVGVGLVAGGIAFGFDDIRTPVGITIGQGNGLLRLAAMVGYLTVHLLVVGTLGFWFSTITDAPLAAVGGAIFTMFVFAILDQVSQLGAIRDWFPTAGEFAWTDLLQSPVDSSALFRGVIQSLVYAAVFTALAFRHFARRDVTS
jgi:ABC-2 type transport system permease protein